ncbi:MAG: formate dehydrogenase family accessory protein FdhD [Flavobacteriaceae bacterium]|nr:formate dehydrogenase family accessory protein FdhD [Flavobacteriaceae bacterium]|tara:strand:- start:8701 stop:9507 length:807 start_codon:yes stop_codon:yes gene_type:complete
MQTNFYQGLKIQQDSFHEIEDAIVVEAPLQININSEAYTVVMRTPGNDMALIRGLLYAEDIYKGNTSLPAEITKEENGIPSIINVTIPQDQLGKGYMNKRTLLSVSSCGICGKTELENLQVEGEQLSTARHFNANHIHGMMKEMAANQGGFQITGGSHAAGIFNAQREMLSLQEDIGRHNAVDKVIGDLLQQQMLKSASYLLVSGRVSFEIVTKAFVAKIPVVVAVSACSSLAIDFAKEFGICLIGFTRTHKLTVYTHINRLEKLTNV